MSPILYNDGSIHAYMDWTTIFSIGSVLLAATIVVRIAGFGGSLVAMPLLVPLIGIHVAAPMMNLFGLVNFSIVLVQQWRLLTIQDIWRLMLLAVLTTPLGVYLLFIVPETALRIALGIICILYALYRLLDLPIPALTHPNWSWLFGAIAGLFGGAFNVSGVPVVIYASTQDWEPERFRLNMFTFFLIISSFALISRYVAGQLTAQVITYWVWTIPFLLLGLAIGHYLVRFVPRDRFQQLVLVLLIVLGGRLIGTAV